MKASDHPKYPEENEHLQSTIQELEGHLNRTSTGEEIWDSPGAVLLKMNISTERAQKCKRALQDLYFGRVDWKRDDSVDSEQFYIGLTEYTPYIYAWQNTLPADLYYNRSTNREQGTLQLIRALQISNRQLVGIDDEFKDPSQTGELEPDSFLDILLRESRGQLHEIVATINAQQYRIIREPLNSALIVQGVPGSGKTVIALHRVSFLLYNHKELRNQSVVVLGPNPIFMQYVSRVLPSLGERQIPQKTFDQWVIDQLGENLSYQSQEELLEFLLSPKSLQAEKVMHLRNCQNMGSTKMGSLLERYVDYLREEALAEKPSLVCRYYFTSGSNAASPIVVQRTIEQIRDVLEEVKTLPLNEQRDALKLKLANQISSEVASKMKIGFQDREQRLKLIFKEIEAQVADYFSNWKAINASVAFRRLFRQRELLHQFGVDLFMKWDLELMAIDAPTPQTPFRFSDLAGLLYFNVLLNGPGKQTYGHIVVDEAQDIPALFFQGLSKYVPQKSITILGDIGQGIFINNGLSSWNDLYQIFPNLNEKVEELNVCYRSTWQIMQNANGLLRKMGLPEDQLIRPLNRMGEDVSFHPSNTAEDSADHIIECIREDQARDWKSIAVICRSAYDCQQLAQEMRARNFDSFELIDHRNRTYDGGVAILPSYLSKGLEFDAVILADAHNYPLDNLSARLLFVAITRAAHKLDICWIGSISPLLDRDLDHVSVETFLGDYQPGVLTVHNYAESRHLDPDDCIEQIARTARLPLLGDGTIDPVVMDMLVYGTSAARKQTSEEVLIVPLKPEEEKFIATLIEDWETQKTDDVRRALTLVETMFGLLKNQMRNLALISAKEEEFTLTEKAIRLVQLKKLLEDADLSIATSRGAGRKRLLEEIDSRRQKHYASVFNVLVDFGLLEMQTSRDERTTLVRLSSDWAKALLDYSLGFPASGLDPDMVEQLPHLPKAIDLSFVTEVSHD